MSIKERSIAPLTGVVRPKTVEKENITVTVNLVPGGLPMLVFLIFLVLKLTGSVAWSWLWVTSPLWIVGMFTILTVVAVAIAVKKTD